MAHDKVRRSPMSLFFPSFTQHSLPGGDGDTEDTGSRPTSSTPTSMRRRLFRRSARSADVPRHSQDDHVSYVETPGAMSYTHDGLLSPTPRLGNCPGPPGAKKGMHPSKSVSFNDLIMYPVMIHQAIRSISPMRSHYQSRSDYAASSDHLHERSTGGSFKKSLSSYILGCGS
uniref:DUF4797 domain-containing protein n=1 Tax=Panagrellus redivivus TaxID=6233 RepID=A0A7E4UMG9_PANRE